MEVLVIVKSVQALVLAVGVLTGGGGGGSPATTTAAACDPLGYDRDALLALRTAGFAIEDPERRERFALDLLDCLGDPDPVLRDQVAYEGFTAMLRGQQLSP